MKHLCIKINWHGPYDIHNVKDSKPYSGIYLLAGKRKYQRESEIQYCGITENAFYRRFANHHTINEITREREIWLGELVYPEQWSREHLEAAEALIIYFWQPELNDKKKVNAPQKAITVISHWLKRDGRPRMKQRAIYKDLDDVLSWDGRYWRTGNLDIYEDD